MPVAAPSAAVVYTFGYWVSVLFVVAVIVAAVYAIAFLAYRARVARERYEGQSRTGDAKADIRHGNDLVMQFAALRRETEREMAESRRRLEGMKDAFDKGLKG